ncbi:MAG: hypothetical protein ACYS67_15695 [Planctomycetota bacterium]|jgi:hypothetical protein
MNTAKTEEEKKVLLEICSGIIEDKIKTIDDFRKVWPKLPFTTTFFNELFEDIEDGFEHMPCKRGGQHVNYKDSFKYLKIYLALQVLKCNKDIKVLESAYRNILAVENLTKEIIDKNIQHLLGE